MRKLLQSKLVAIKLEMKTYEYIPQYHLMWKQLKAKESIIIEIMTEYDTMCRKPIIEDIELNYNMGIISLQDKEKQINSICIDY